MDEKEAVARPVMGNIFLVFSNFTHQGVTFVRVCITEPVTCA